MPHFLIPHKSGVHRAACFALFRALLRQKNRLAAGEQRDQLESLLKISFHKNAKENSSSVIVGALRRGYEFLHFLNQCVKGSSHLPSRLVDCSTVSISCRPTDQQGKIPSFKLKSEMNRPPTQGGPRVWPHPNTIPIQNRPLAVVSGRRHVPYLANANGFPFLRLKKPESPYLGRLIRDNLRLRHKRIARNEELRTLIFLGEHEDKWDEALGISFGINRGKWDFSWAREAKKGLSQVMVMQEAVKKKRALMGKVMAKIVKKEEELDNAERAKRRGDKRQARRLRKLAQKTSSSEKVKFLRSPEFFKAT